MDRPSDSPPEFFRLTAAADAILAADVATDPALRMLRQWDGSGHRPIDSHTAQELDDAMAFLRRIGIPLGAKGAHS